MGYTHYWTFKKAPKEIENGEIKFANAVTLFKEGLKKLKNIPLANGYGEDEPEITNKVVWFNGKAPDDYETCHMSIETKGSEFCKTGRMPYDPAVCLLLLCMAHEFENDFTYSSDGDIQGSEEGWGIAKNIFDNIL